MIESTQNSQVKFWKKLKRKKYRDQEQMYIIEGDHLVQEAIKNLKPSRINQILVTPDKAADFEHLSHAKVELISPKVANELADTQHTQASFAIIEKTKTTLAKKINRPFLFIDGIQDPGNLGSIIRTAAAAHFEAIVLGQGTVDAYNMKVLRGAQGMHFKLDLYEGDLMDWVDYFQSKNLSVFGTSLAGGAQSYRRIHPSKQPFALILGNEGAGSQKALLEKADLNLYIPLAKGVESLNVAVAAGILAFYLYDFE